MEFTHFSKNGELRPIEEATIPLSSIEYAYGFGVYEAIRVSNGVIYFLNDHLERLCESATVIGLEHPFTVDCIQKSIFDLVAHTSATSYNIKILLIGGQTRETASLFVLCLNPLFTDKKLYRDGAHVITYPAERIFPHAKTLNMLQSYRAYATAKQQGAYDALLVNRNGTITEGTRTNFFCIRDHVIITPPEKDILLGVTRKALLHVAQNNGYTLEEKNITQEDCNDYDGAFISSTSSKIIPLRTINDQTLSVAPDALKKLMRLFDEFLATCNGTLIQ